MIKVVVLVVNICRYNTVNTGTFDILVLAWKFPHCQALFHVSIIAYIFIMKIYIAQKSLQILMSYFVIIHSLCQLCKIWTLRNWLECNTLRYMKLRDVAWILGHIVGFVY